MPLDLNSPAGEPPPTVCAIAGAIGIGKTQTWRERVASKLITERMNLVLAIPRHRLGDEVARDLAALGISAYVYRGRDADDPEASGQKMCRELDRANLISEALGSVSPRACKHGDRRCRFYDVCGYQRQRRQRPQLWVVPHQLLFRERPSFIPQPDVLTIDESFYGASLNGLDTPVRLWLTDLREFRHVPKNVVGTADLNDLSAKVHRALLGSERGQIRRAAIVDAGIGVDDQRRALQLEWQRKMEITEVFPNMPIEDVAEICERVAANNQLVKRLTQFWTLVISTLEAPDERSPWLDYRPAEGLPTGDGTEPAVRMAWRDDIHSSWLAPTLVLDGMMQLDIVRQFFPQLNEPCVASAAMPFTRVRQITDRPMAASMLITSPRANERANATRDRNVERMRQLIEVRANDVRPSRALVVAQQGLELALLAGGLPENVEVAHFNAVAGENAWNDVALIMVIGRTEPSPRTIEATTRVLFGAQVREVEPDAKGELYWPTVRRGIRMRDGSAVRVDGHLHPDPRAEAVRWSTCEAELMQAIGRARGVNRTAVNPLQIDIVTNVVLPIEVDEVTTWEDIQPALAQVMHARGAVPSSYADMAAAYTDLFPTGEAARKALERENPGQMTIKEYILISVCPGFSSLSYRRAGARGPASTLLYDPDRVDPVAWLRQRLGEVTIVPTASGSNAPCDAAADKDGAVHPADEESAASASEADWDAYEERAAILEVDAGLPRAGAERRARQEFLGTGRS